VAALRDLQRKAQPRDAAADHQDVKMLGAHFKALTACRTLTTRC
jgi:hypothetical protein